MSNIEYRPVVEFFTRKGLNVTKISKELDNVDKHDPPSYHTIAKKLAQFKESERAFEDPPRTDPTSTITTDQNIQIVQWIVICDWQISICRLAYELPISTVTVYEIISNDLGMKKVSTRWVMNTYSTFSHCY